MSTAWQVVIWVIAGGLLGVGAALFLEAWRDRRR